MNVLRERLIRISSNDKVASLSSTNSNFTVYLKGTSDIQQVKRILVKSVSVPNVLYNIHSASGTPNNILRIEEKGQAAQDVTIPPAQYTITTLMTAIQTAVNAVTATAVLTVTQDAATQKLTFTFATNTCILYNEADGSSIAPAIGLLTTTADGASHVMDYIPDLSGTRILYIHSQELAGSNLLDGDSGLISVLEAVSMNETEFGAYAYLQNNDTALATVDYKYPKDIGTVSIKLRDDKGAIVDIGTATMSVLIKIYY